MLWIGGFISADWKFELLLHCAKHLRLLRQAFPTIGIFESEEVVPRHAELQILQKHGADRPVCQWGFHLHLEPSRSGDAHDLANSIDHVVEAPMNRNPAFRYLAAPHSLVASFLEPVVQRHPQRTPSRPEILELSPFSNSILLLQRTRQLSRCTE
jgi:hypothetical protein